MTPRITGTNNMPLGPRRPLTGVKHEEIKPTNLLLLENSRSRPRRCRWSTKTAAENHMQNLLGMPTALTSPMTSEQLDAYALQLRIKEITEKLYTNNIVPTHRERSPSPTPIYDNTGRRMNTREVRHRQKLEDERHTLVMKAVKTIPAFKLPHDYRRTTKTQEKIYIPVNEFPEINFIGQLLGCRGKDLKEMEVKSGAKIFIRGKGSVKEGKLKKEEIRNLVEEDLHCLIVADSEDKLAAAVALVQEVIETAASVPEEQNEHKQKQMIDVAKMNGTYRDDEAQRCLKCGEQGHRQYNCPQTSVFTANIVCYRCNRAGHLQKDCNADVTQEGRANQDQEYRDFMAEIYGGAPDLKSNPQTISRSLVPWRQQQYATLPSLLHQNSLSTPTTPSCYLSPPGTSVTSGITPSMTNVYGPPPGCIATYTFGNVPPPPAANSPLPPPTWNAPPPPPAWG